MEDSVGFAIFGRPEGQQSIVNGLIKSYDLEPDLYLSNLTGEILLEKGETVAVIKQLAKGQGTNAERLGVTLVALLSYAESYGITSRPGGFVGSAVCFKGFPSAILVQKALLTLHKQAMGLIDSESKKFIAPNKENWAVKLPDLNENWLGENPNIVSSKFQPGTKIGIGLNGSIGTQLLGIVQGFVSNPAFNSYQTCMISESRAFLQKLKGRVNLVSPYALFDYSKAHALLTSNLNKIRDVQSTETEKLVGIKTDINSAKNQQSELQRTFQSLNEQAEQLKKDIHDLKVHQIELKGKNDKLGSDLSSLSGLSGIRFDQDVLNGPLRPPLDKYVDKKVYSTLNRKSAEWKDERDKDYIELRTFKRVLMACAIIILTLLLIIVIPKVWQAVRTLQSSNSTVVDSTLAEISIIENNVPIETASSKLEIPDEITFSDWNKLNKPDQHARQKAVYQLISEITSLNNSDSFLNNEVKKALLRKWHWSELLVPNSKGTAYDTVVGPIGDLENLYKAFGIEENWSFSCDKECSVTASIDGLDTSESQELSGFLTVNSFFFLDRVSGKDVEFKKHNFNSSNRYTIFRDYLGEKGNVYKKNGIDYGIDLNDKAAIDSSVLFEHFRWMIYELSEHNGQHKDIVRTSKKSHRIPIVKKK